MSNRELVEKGLIEYRNYILATIRKYVRNEADADDILGQVALRALQGCESYKAKAHLRHWLARIAVNSTTDHFRKVTRHPAVSLDLIEEREAPRLTPSPFLQDIVEALTMSPNFDLFLASADGITLREMAEARGCPVGTIKSQMDRCRRTVRKSKEFAQLTSWRTRTDQSE